MLMPCKSTKGLGVNIIDIESVVLGSILNAYDYGATDLNIVFSKGITSEWFSDVAYQSIFEVMQICHDGGSAYDEKLILSYLKKREVQNPEYVVLDLVAQKQIPQAILLEHIEVLREAHAKKILTKAHAEVGLMLQEENISSDAIMQLMQNVIDKHVTLSRVSGAKRLSEVRALRKSQPPVQRIPTLIPFIDTVLTDQDGNVGLRNEGLMYISGLKESGKTYVMTRIVENVSKTHPVLFGSLEFGKDLYDENVERQEKQNFWNGNIDNIFTFDDIYDINKMSAEIRLMHKLHNIVLAAIDSKMRVTNDNKDLKTDERRITEVFSKLAKLSKELKIPIIIIVQSAKEDLKSSIISVKGSMEADHEAYTWFHLTKTKKDDPTSELRTVVWNKNKDTHKHPKQYLMFVPQTSDFYRVEIDADGNPTKALDSYRRPPAQEVVITHENIPSSLKYAKKKDAYDDDDDVLTMPQF